MFYVFFISLFVLYICIVTFSFLLFSWYLLFCLVVFFGFCRIFKQYFLFCLLCFVISVYCFFCCFCHLLISYFCFLNLFIFSHFYSLTIELNAINRKFFSERCQKTKLVMMTSQTTAVCLCTAISMLSHAAVALQFICCWLYLMQLHRCWNELCKKKITGPAGSSLMDSQLLAHL